MLKVNSNLSLSLLRKEASIGLVLLPKGGQRLGGKLHG